MKVDEIKRTWQKMGDDYTIHVFGGEKPHIGTTVIAQASEQAGRWQVTCTTWNRLGHRDDEIATRYAKALSLATKGVVVCTSGVHYDAITPEKITEILHWCEQDIQKLLKEIQTDETNKA
ncbi:MAG: hypothetical protein ACRDCC_07105 [Culicoidibacterales bacterium]